VELAPIVPTNDNMQVFGYIAKEIAGSVGGTSS
jgi:hypothetical protein